MKFNGSSDKIFENPSKLKCEVSKKFEPPLVHHPDHDHLTVADMAEDFCALLSQHREKEAKVVLRGAGGDLAKVCLLLQFIAYSA